MLASPLGGRRIDQLQIKATTAFFTHAGNARFDDPTLSAAAANAQQDGRGPRGAPSPLRKMVFSGSHNGYELQLASLSRMNFYVSSLATYLGRLLYPLWTENIVVGRKEVLLCLPWLLLLD